MSGYPGPDPYSQPPGWTGAPPFEAGPVLGVSTPSTVGGPPSREQLAGFWIRFAAALLDGILVGVVVALVTVPVGLSPFNFTASIEAGSSPGSTTAGNPGGALGSLIQTLIAGTYTVYLLGTPAGQTVGMKATGIRVADAYTGGRISYGRSFARYAMGIVSALPLALGYLWMLWDARGQTWHDKVAQSLVVRTRYLPPPAPFGKPPS